MNGPNAHGMIGSDVNLRDLKGRADLNGKRGRIQDWMEDRGRFNVQVEENGEVIAVKPSNLLRIRLGMAKRCVGEGLSSAQTIVGHKCLFAGLNGRADLNQKGGSIVAYLQEKQRYQIKVDKSGEVIAVKPDNIEVLDAPDDSVPKYEVPKAKAQGTMKAEPKAVPKTEDTKAEPIPSKPVYNDETKKEPLRSSANVNTRGNHNNDTTTEKKADWQPPLKKSEVVIYTMTGEKVTVMKVHSEDDINDPYYTIQMADEREKQTVRNKLQTEATITIGGETFTHPVAFWAAEGDILGNATVGSDKSLSLDKDLAHFQLCLDYLNSLSKTDRRGSVTLPKARSGLKKLKKDVDFYGIIGFSTMIEKALVELSLNF